ncbi:MAG: M1 family metallopeptidase [Pseudomonadota bacterium]
MIARPLLAASLIVLTAAATPPPKGLPPLTAQTQRSGGSIDPEQAKQQLDTVDLAIEVMPASQSISGVATLNFIARAPLTRLLIDLDRNLPVSAIAIDGKPLPRSAWANPEGRLTIALPAPVAANGTVTAKISYGGTPHVAVRAPWDGGFVWSRTPASQPWIATAVQGEGCDLFWPCLDFPTAEPRLVDLHITVPKGLKAPSNGVLLGVDKLANGRTTWNWRAKHPNMYAIALNIAPYEEISGTYKSRFGNSFPMTYWYLPGEEKQARALFAEFAPTLDFFESTIGPYPFGDEKVGVVETPHKGMEHQTINGYGNAYAKAPEGFDWLFQHELAHEWFANQLTAADWDDMWLHEGYATYMQPLYGRWREGEARYAAMMLANRTDILNNAAIVSGHTRTEEGVYQLDKGGPGTDIYYKASWMLHTLRYLIGDQAFGDVTRLAVYGRPDPKPGNFAPRYGSTAEYQQFVDQVTGADHRWFFDVYLRQAALPELIEVREGSKLTLSWKVPGDLPFPMPVEVQVDGKDMRVAMAGGTGTITVAPEAHVVTDPNSRILKRSIAVEELQAWRSAIAAKGNGK